MALACAGVPPASLRTAASPFTPDSVRTIIDKYCVTCHNQRLRTAGLSIEALDTTDVPANAELWEKVIAKLRTRAMPPAGSPRPDATTAAEIVDRLEASLDEAAARRPN